MRQFFITSAFLVVLVIPQAFAQANSWGGTSGTAPQSSVNNSPSQVQSGVTNTNNPSSGTTLINPLKGVDCSRGGDCLSSFLLNIMDFIIKIGTIAVILMLIFVGFKFVVAQGNDSKISEARNMLLWTIIGALVLLGAKAISMGILATVQKLSG